MLEPATNTCRRQRWGTAYGRLADCIQAVSGADGWAQCDDSGLHPTPLAMSCRFDRASFRIMSFSHLLGIWVVLSTLGRSAYIRAFVVYVNEAIVVLINPIGLLLR